jgi:uncharacterized protein (TIGR02217 family)
LFFELEFPTAISFLAMGGPTFSTNVNEGYSGEEQRNQNWRNCLGKWTISLVTPARQDRQQYIYLLDSFFLNVRGRGDAFRFKDHKDFRARGVQIGMGNGSATVFQLQKTYQMGSRIYFRKVTKPIDHTTTDYKGNPLADTLVVYVAGTPLASSAWTLDATTGLVTLTAAPADRALVTTDFDFHHPVRFDVDDMQRQIQESYVHGGNPIVSLNSLTLWEVRPPRY